MSNRQTLFALGELINATRLLADSVREAARQLHEETGLSVPARAVLLELRRGGPRTVPQLARQRGVTRQSIQTTVNPLVKSGLLEARPNPAHRRSPLIALTGAGVELVRRVMRREGDLLGDLAADFAASDLRQATETVAELERAFAQTVPRPWRAREAEG